MQDPDVRWANIEELPQVVQNIKEIRKSLMTSSVINIFIDPLLQNRKFFFVLTIEASTEDLILVPGILRYFQPEYFLFSSPISHFLTSLL